MLFCIFFDMVLFKVLYKFTITVHDLQTEQEERSGKSRVSQTSFSSSRPKKEEKSVLPIRATFEKPWWERAGLLRLSKVQCHN